MEFSEGGNKSGVRNWEVEETCVRNIETTNGNKERRRKKRVQGSVNVDKKKETQREKERERERVVYELTPDEKARSPAKFKFL